MSRLFSYKNIFNKMMASDTEARLLYSMTQAFYRSDMGTIDLLEKDGAPFTIEMLQVAVAMQNEVLTDKCLAAKVAPDESVLLTAVEKNNATIFGALLAKATAISDELHAYVKLHGSPMLQKLLKAKIRALASL
jgi:hypothetical protein